MNNGGERAVRRMVLSTLLALTVSAVVVWWLLSDAVIDAFAEAFERAHLWRLVAAFALVPVVQGFRAWRFGLLTDGRAHPPSWTMYTIAARLLMFNYLLPFKLGELSFPLMMKRAFGTDYFRALGVLILARLMDLCMVGAVAALGAAFLIDSAADSWGRPALLLVAMVALLLPVVGIGLLAPLGRLSARLLRLSPWFDHKLRHEILVHPLRQRAQAFALTVAIWLTHATLAWLAASAVADGMGFFQIMLANASSSLAFALPVNGLVGLGPPQAAWATALYLTGAAWEPAIVTALICHGILVSGAFAVGSTTFVVPGSRPLWPRPAAGRRGGAEGLRAESGRLPDRPT